MKTWAVIYQDGLVNLVDAPNVMAAVGKSQNQVDRDITDIIAVEDRSWVR